MLRVHPGKSHVMAVDKKAVNSWGCDSFAYVTGAKIHASDRLIKIFLLCRYIHTHTINVYNSLFYHARYVVNVTSKNCLKTQPTFLEVDMLVHLRYTMVN